MEIQPQLVEKLRQARSIAVLTGAGVSAESGIPTFREAQTGLWARYDPLELATPEAFHRNPELVWNWYAWRREQIRAAKPNPAHFALAKMEECVNAFTLITQNVDSLHLQAGSCNLVELHGNIHRNRCHEEGRVILEEIDSADIPPRCPYCGGLLRPDVVWFKEQLPPEALQRAVEAAGNCEVFFSIGTSGLVEPAASLGFLARSHGADLVEINPQVTPFTRYTQFSIREPAGDFLSRLLEKVWLN